MTRTTQGVTSRPRPSRQSRIEWARKLTEDIRRADERLYDLTLEAWEGKIHKVLGYSDFKDWWMTEIGKSNRSVYRMIAQARVIRELTAAAELAPERVAVTQRQGQKMKNNVAEVAEQVRAATNGKSRPERARIAAEVIEVATRGKPATGTPLRPATLKAAQAWHMVDRVVTGIKPAEVARYGMETDRRAARALARRLVKWADGFAATVDSEATGSRLSA